jgi:thioredoxin 1
VTSDKSEKIAHISDTSFEQEVLKAGRPVLIDFWPNGAAPARRSPRC